MSVNSRTYFPKLRQVDIRPVSHNGQPFLHLRDPMQLSGKHVMIPYSLTPVLMMLDGHHNYTTMRESLARNHSLQLNPDMLDRFISTLDDALLLQNARFTDAKNRALVVYRQAPFRPPSNAGRDYPSDKDSLAHLLDGYLAATSSPGINPTNLRGLVSPHIDYERGGTVYASVWNRAAQAAQDADLAVIIGTNHNGDSGHLTLTHQHYATPYGTLHTDTKLVSALAAAIGEKEAFRHELDHRVEHSIELAATWLHHIRKRQPITLLPILVGSFGHFASRLSSPHDDSCYAHLVDTLHENTLERRILVVAAGDMSHVGPAFNGQPLGQDDKNDIRTSDSAIVNAMCTGNPDLFFTSVQEIGDITNICGLAPIYLTLRILNPTQGHPVAYEQCPADEQHTSIVSVCGVVFE